MIVRCVRVPHDVFLTANGVGDDNYQTRRWRSSRTKGTGRAIPRRVEHDRVQIGERSVRRLSVAVRRSFSADFSAMNAEIKTKKTGSKWHGLIEGRPDIDETGLTEEVARRKVESVRARLGDCGSPTKLFGGLTCELVKGHVAAIGQRLQHKRDGKSWIDVSSEDGAGAFPISGPTTP